MQGTFSIVKTYESLIDKLEAWKATTTIRRILTLVMSFLLTSLNLFSTLSSALFATALAHVLL